MARTILAAALILGVASGCATAVEGAPCLHDHEPAVSEVPIDVVDEVPEVMEITYDGIPDDWKETIERAVDEWARVGVNVGTVHIQGTPDWRTVEGGKVWAWFNRPSRTIFLSTDRPPAVDVWRSALHELGHAAGADHHAGHGVMRGVGTFGDMTYCITPADLALFGLTGPGTCDPETKGALAP